MLWTQLCGSGGRIRSPRYHLEEALTMSRTEGSDQASNKMSEERRPIYAPADHPIYSRRPIALFVRRGPLRTTEPEAPAAPPAAIPPKQHEPAEPNQ